MRINTHTWLTERLFEEKPGVIAEFAEYKGAFLAGAMVPDITVAYYYSEGGTKYRATHNWNFQDSVLTQAQTPDERAFAYGIASHLIADSVSHTMAIPEKIKAYHIPNWLIHPLVEKKYDSLLALNNPGLKEKSRHMLDSILKGEEHLLEGETLAYHDERAERYMEMVEVAMDLDNFDVEENLIRLGYALDAFYQYAKRPEGGGIFAMYPMIDAMTDWIYPLSVGSMDNVEFYVEKSYEENTNIMLQSNWGNRVLLNPNGFDALTKADESAVNVFHVFLFGFIILMFAIPIFLMWWRRDPRFLVFIPILFFLGVLIMMIIYIIV